MQCSKCGERFTSEHLSQQHYGKQGACLNPALIPVMQRASDGKRWKSRYMDYDEYLAWQRTRCTLTRLEPEDFDMWVAEMTSS